MNKTGMVGKAGWVLSERMVYGLVVCGCCSRVMAPNARLSFGWKLRQMGGIAKSSKMVF